MKWKKQGWELSAVKIKTPFLEIEWKPRQENSIPIYIVSKHSGKCLDVSWASLEDGANIIQFYIHGGKNQKWLFKPVGEGCYLIINKLSYKCLDVSSWGTKDGTEIIQYSIHGGDNQKWLLKPTGDGYYQILSKHSGKCLDVSGWSQHDGAKIIQHSAHDGDNQKWELRSAEMDSA